MEYKRGKYLGCGYYSNVYENLLDKDTVVKYSRVKDGTYHYLEWIVKTKPRAKWIPKVYHLEARKRGGYVVVMKKYEDINLDYAEGKEKCKVLERKVYNRLDDYIASAYGGRIAKHGDIEGDEPVLDIHRGNIMYCPEKTAYILTDPLAGPAYRKRAKKTVKQNKGIQ
jgi:hypothetical protein